MLFRVEVALHDQPGCVVFVSTATGLSLERLRRLACPIL